MQAANVGWRIVLCSAVSGPWEIENENIEKKIALLTHKNSSNRESYVTGAGNPLRPPKSGVRRVPPYDFMKREGVPKHRFSVRKQGNVYCLPLWRNCSEVALELL